MNPGAEYIGLMSGTSLDGVDGVRVRLYEPARHGPLGLELLGHVHRPFAPALRAELLALCTPGGHDELHRAACAARGVAQAYAEVVQVLVDGLPALPRALGAHGQTVRHMPDPAAGGYTVQLLDAAWLAEHSGIDVVADFRSRDVAAGGQGAPLVPAFHARLFGSAQRRRAVLNLGGIANLSLLDGEAVTGFDCGPANLLLDGWCQRHTGQAFDDDGRYGASAPWDSGLLAALSSEPYFERRPPKSTGRELFNLPWLDAALAAAGATHLPPAVVQSTLCQLTVQGVVQALRQSAPDLDELWVCGGGAFNGDLMRRLAAALPRVQVGRTDALGVPVDQVEACAFAWLAHAFLEGEPGNLPAVTGARGPRRLGSWTPAR